MGGQNVLAGRVSAVTDSMVVLDLPNRGRVEFPARDPMPPTGSTVHIAVRRDRVHLAKRTGDGGADSVNAISGKVRAIEYQGTWVKVTLEGAGGEDFVVNLRDSDFVADPVNAGDAVRAHWTATDVHLLVGGAGRNDRPYATGEN
jgi:putative spermidine/putrescine transport system ATP-binding protein